MITESKDTNVDVFFKWLIVSFLLGMTKFIAKEIIYFALIVALVLIAMYFLIAVYVFLRENYVKGFISWLRVRKFRNEFRKRISPFYGWKYELLVPPLYFPWDEVIRDKPLRKKKWIPETEFHYHDTVYDEARLIDEDHDVLQFGELTIGCQHENFVTLYHRGNRKFRNLDFKEEGLLHVCLKCQKQIGYDGVGLN